MNTTLEQDVEMAARALWVARFGYEPTEPLRTKGGALDPDAWCMEAAEAVLTGKPVPGIATNVSAPEWVPKIVKGALIDG